MDTFYFPSVAPSRSPLLMPVKCDLPSRHPVLFCPPDSPSLLSGPLTLSVSLLETTKGLPAATRLSAEGTVHWSPQFHYKLMVVACLLNTRIFRSSQLINFQIKKLSSGEVKWFVQNFHGVICRELEPVDWLLTLAPINLDRFFSVRKKQGLLSHWSMVIRASDKDPKLI